MDFGPTITDVPLSTTPLIYPVWFSFI